LGEPLRRQKKHANGVFFLAARVGLFAPSAASLHFAAGSAAIPLANRAFGALFSTHYLYTYFVETRFIASHVIQEIKYYLA
jgi:hypothetical protein